MSHGRLATALPALCFGILAWTMPAAALDELKHEKKAISVCERQLCAMLVNKEAKGPDLKCDLTKTWGRKTIKNADSSSLSWAFGDARCTVKINVRRSEIVHAITAEKAKFYLSDQHIDCIVEEGEDGRDARHVIVVVSPKIEFKGGRAEKIWINLKHTDGPGAITGTLQFAAKLADNLGLFHSQMLKAVNGFIYKGCPKVLTQSEEVAEAKPAKKVARKKPEKPAAEAPVAEKPAEDKPAAEKPTAEAPAAKPE